jgi:hypothetical protein
VLFCHSLFNCIATVCDDKPNTLCTNWRAHVLELGAYWKEGARNVLYLGSLRPDFKLIPLAIPALCPCADFWIRCCERCAIEWNEAAWGCSWNRAVSHLHQGKFTPSLRWRNRASSHLYQSEFSLTWITKKGISHYGRQSDRSAWVPTPQCLAFTSHKVSYPLRNMFSNTLGMSSDPTQHYFL